MVLYDYIRLGNVSFESLKAEQITIDALDFTDAASRSKRTMAQAHNASRPWPNIAFFHSLRKQNTTDGPAGSREL